MQPKSKISSIWNDAKVTLPYASGLSLHSHTSHSEESLYFIHKLLISLPGLRHIFAHYERTARQCGVPLDFVRAHWRPPLQPRMAYELEHSQVTALGLEPLISLTDHDSIAAPMLLRTVPSARHIPVSLEWTVPFGAAEFHLGIHNLPAAEGHAWMSRFAAYTAKPSDSSLVELLHELHHVPGVLVVLNHPLWDLHSTGGSTFRLELLRLLETIGRCIHALELNGLRDARENRGVVQLARETGYLLISGGDRHGVEPNGNINLSRASCFRDFVDEIRVERRSHILFLAQYARPWEQRMLHSTLSAVTDYPDFMEGWQRWDQRAFHPDAQGILRPLSELWPGGRAPLPLLAAVRLVRLSRSNALSYTFCKAFPETVDPQAEMELL